MTKKRVLTEKRESEITHGIYILFGAPALVGLLVAGSEPDAPANGLWGFALIAMVIGLMMAFGVRGEA
jgi:hypothetical protein